MLQEDGAGGARWVLLLAQLPASPSGPRVALWRRARAAGAAGLQNGAWALPHTAEHVALFAQLGEMVRGQGGSAFVLSASAPAAGVDAEIVARFGADRAREYTEFAERCAGLLAEIGTETGQGRFTFAELEEVEQDLEKLSGWLEKIGARDFFPGEDAARAADRLERCREAVAGFAQAVYAAEGLGGSGAPPPAGTAAQARAAPAGPTRPEGEP